MQRAADAMIGRVLDGRYRVDARIARGGMATVYRAHDLRLDRGCAVKVMHPDLGDDHDFAARFVREAHAAARLSHPHVVAVTDQGDDDGVLFLVMEHLPGRTLREVVREESPMTPARALELLEPVLAALAEAHRSGLVHRDVKPENVLIGDDGRIKVADFGLARAFDSDSTSTATRGVLLGTVSYLAPEVIVSGRADPRSDVYAAGVLLFEMLTGHKPHEGEGPVQVAFKHVNEDVPAPSTRTAGPVPAYVDALVLRAAARERERRPADARVLLTLVRRVRAAVEAGEADDPELTADLLPAVRVVEEAEAGAGPAPVTVDDLPTVEAEEQTVVIAAVGARATAATGGRTTAARGVTAVSGRAGGPSRAQALPPQPRAGAPGPGRSTVPPRAPEEPGATPRGPRGRRSRGPLLLLVVALLTALVAYGGWWLGVGRYTSTPGVLNLPVGAATDKVEDAGLRVEVAERVFSETVTAGSVIGTDPEPGERILEGGTVRVVVSRGPERYEVPALAGKRARDVAGLLATRNLEVGTLTRVWHEEVPRGTVVATAPAAGTELRRGDTVDVTVSKGREPIEIPDLTGRDADRAEERLTRLGFEIETTERHDAEVPEGDVVAQNPTRGTGHRGDTVRLVVSKGPVMVDVPRLGTLSVAEATAELEAVGLRIAVVRTDLYIGLDRVVRQSPGTGGSVPEGDVVTVYIV